MVVRCAGVGGAGPAAWDEVVPGGGVAGSTTEGANRPLPDVAGGIRLGGCGMISEGEAPSP
jgi:hypothetical protein